MTENILYQFKDENDFLITLKNLKNNKSQLDLYDVDLVKKEKDLYKFIITGYVFDDEDNEYNLDFDLSIYKNSRNYTIDNLYIDNIGYEVFFRSYSRLRLKDIYDNLLFELNIEEES